MTTSCGVEVHGGLTYADEDGWIGFDTAHYGDTRAKWPAPRVIFETQHLCAQIANAPGWKRAES